MINIKNLTVIFPDGTRAVDNVSISIDQGELLILIGPSGCGKTTTLKTINRLIPFSKGRILIEGTDILQIDPIKLRRQIGYVIQQIGLFPHMNIRENICYIMKLNRESGDRRNERAEELIRLVGLPEDYLEKYPVQLSGGQQQRVGVARALAADPKIILMDEPFGALDPITRVQLQDEFIDLQKQLKKTVVFVTHSMQEAYKLAHRIVIMRSGRFVQIGSPVEIFLNPADEFVSDFIGAQNILEFYKLVKVKQALYKELPQGYLGQPLDRLVAEMREKHWDSVPVTDENGVFKGIVSLNNVESGGKKLEEHHLSPVKDCINENEILSRALEILLINGVGYLPVVDDAEKFKGIITYNSFQNVISAKLVKDRYIS